MVSPKMAHLVDYLNTSVAHTDQGKIVVITIRPDKDSFRPHNIALLRPQAERLLIDLKRLLTATTILLLLFSMSGCSSRFSATTESRIHSADSERAEKCHTSVALGLLTDQEERLQSPMTEKVSTLVAVNVLPSPTQEEQPPQVTNLITVTNNTVTNNTVTNNTVTNNTVTNFHHHLHLHEAPKRIKPTPSPPTVEVQRRLEDPHCERLRREHEQRVAGWKVMFSRGQQ